MAESSKIEWTDATWTPIRARRMARKGDGFVARVGWHCEHVSEGCRNCYAERQNKALFGTGLDYKPGNLHPRGAATPFLDEDMLLRPMRWRRPRKIFVCSMTDLFADFVSDEWIDRIFAVMALCPQHIFQVLTKRPHRMRDYFAKIRHEGGHCDSMAIVWQRAMDLATEHGGLDRYQPQITVLPNVWLGVSVEDQAAANERIPLLMETPAAVRFLSCEPLLGFVVLSEAWHGESALDSECWGECGWCPAGFSPLHNCQQGRQTEDQLNKGRSGVDWVIAGGESGPNARPMDPEWVRLIRDECAEAGVPFHFKQWGEYRPCTEAELKTACGATLVGNRNDGAYVLRVGKRKAGRLLDGVQHDGAPA